MEGVLFNDRIITIKHRHLKLFIVEIKLIDPKKEPLAILEIVKAYKLAFASDPWNEGYVCPSCEANFPLTEKAKVCPKCFSAPLVEYWPTAKVVTDFYQEASKPNFICLALSMKSRIIGFTWGYSIIINKDSAKKLDAPGLEKLITDKFFYIDEVAIIPSRQGHGLGRKLFESLLKNIKNEKIILRTKNNSIMSNLTKQFGGEIIKKISNKRVIIKLSS